MDTIARTTPKERADLFIAASQQRPTISAAIMEKDFWVCWALKRIFAFDSFPFGLIFKGGTALSKAFGVIDRFSEDVDLSFDRNQLGFDAVRDPEKAASGKKQKQLLDRLRMECEMVIRERLVPAMRTDFASVLGASKDGLAHWDIQIDPDDQQTVSFLYPPALASQGVAVPAYIRPAVRLEMGARSDSWPANKHRITPYSAQLFPGMFTVSSCEVNTLEAVRTFWEKATILHAEAHRAGPTARNERMSRHYYDLYRLCGTAIGDQALKRLDLLERVVAHKTVFFRSAWAHYETAVPGTFRLLPPASRMPLLQRDYGEMRAMIFGEFPQWDEIVRGLQALENRINGG